MMFRFAPLLAAALLATADPAANDSRGVIVTPHGGAAADSAARTAPVAFSKRVFATAALMPAPVAFALDDSGAVYTANANRYDGHGLFDNRLYPIVRDDITITSVADRRRLTEKWVRSGVFDSEDHKVTLAWLSRFADQVRRLDDVNGDGVADHVSLLADSLNDLVQGAAAGVLPWNGDVYATVIPDLWRLRDSTHTGHWQRTSMQTGFGLHMGQGGHDMHGLVMGNDGRLYWSIADRGYDITTREGRRFVGHSGAVFRCWPDGSQLERVAQGLRNPQELAFTDAGDLFTGDNNADVGDRARLAYLPFGADAGWTFYMQYVRGCGAWTREHMWETALPGHDPAQPAWIALPIDYLSTCPSGFAAYPGTGLPARYDGTLWLVDYVTGIEAFRIEPRGAGFAMRDWHWAYRDSWGMNDVDFGADGNVWVLYWGESWGINELSRLVTLTPRDASVDTATVAEVRALLRGGFASLAEARLAQLLGHRDRRVRQRASFELAHRGLDRVLADAATHGSTPLARMHALWALGVLAHEHPGANVVPAFTAALADPDADVRRVAAFALGDAGPDAKRAGGALVKALADPSPRVRLAAAQAIAALKVPSSSELIDALAANDDADPWLRFAYARALAAVMPAPELAALAPPASHASRAVRLGAVLAIREAGADAAAPFLADADPQIATEAARAAYDLEQPDGMRALAATLANVPPELRTDAYLRRALHAALRLGGPAEAEAVAAFAADSTTSAAWRDEALQVLAQWDRPDPRDGVLSRWRPLPARVAGRAHAAIVAHLGAILAHARGDDLADAIDLARRESFTLPTPLLASWVADENVDERARRFALQWLAARRAPETGRALAAALTSRSDSLCALGLRLAAAVDPARAAAAAQRIAETPATPLAVRQAAIRSLGRVAAPAAGAWLTARVADVKRGTLDSSLVLDVLESARGSASPALRTAARAAARPAKGSTDSLAAFAAALRGGDAARGRVTFETHAGAQCIKCHTIDGTGGTIGPDLSVIGTRDRRYLLQSIVDPNARLASGFESTMLTLRDSSTVFGQVKEEDAAHFVLKLDDGTLRSVPRDSVIDRPTGGSTMPPMIGVLTLGEMRDVIEWLVTRRDVTPDVALDAAAARPAAAADAPPARDRSALGGALALGGRTWTRGLGVRAPSRLAIPVPAGATAFVARCGIDDASPGGLVAFEVRVGGRVAWRSPPMKHGAAARAWAAIPNGATRIELIVDDGGNGPANDVADWIEPGFVR